MGIGGYMNLINGSPFDWTVSGTHSYQMDAWSWPTVPAGESSKVYLEWGTKGTITDDGGEAYYDIAGTSDKFSVLARNPNNFHLYVSLDNLDTNTNNPGDRVDAGFRHDQGVNWILSQDDQGTFWTNNNPPIDWMRQSLPTIGNRKLKHVCMPGSHDAGMSELNAHTAGAIYTNTQTQLLNIYNQLIYGSRYFDIRPVVSAGQFVTGHYSEVEGVWFGGNGESLADIISQINQFTATNHELVILYLSHTLDSDSWTDLTQTQWNALFKQLQGLNNLYLTDSPPSDLTSLTLNQLLPKDSATVLVVAELPSGITLDPASTKGIFPSSAFPRYDSYSNSDNPNTMITDQLSKLSSQRNVSPSNTKDTFHVLSWTLTQQNPLGDAIVNIAVSVWDDLYTRGYSAFTPESFPNVLYMDAFSARDRSVLIPSKDGPDDVPAFWDVAALAVAVNFGVAGRNGFVTGK